MIKTKEIKVEVGGNPKNKKDGVIYFESFEEMNKILTSGRLSIIETVRKEAPSSVYELSKIMEKDQANLNKDIKILEEYGFLEIRKDKDGDRIRNRPKTDYDLIEMTIKVGAGMLGVAKDVLEEVGEEFRGEKAKANKEYVKGKFEDIGQGIKRNTKRSVSPAKKKIKKISRKLARKIVELSKEDEK